MITVRLQRLGAVGGIRRARLEKADGVGHSIRGGRAGCGGLFGDWRNGEAEELCGPVWGRAVGCSGDFGIDGEQAWADVCADGGAVDDRGGGGLLCVCVCGELADDAEPAGDVCGDERDYGGVVWGGVWVVGGVAEVRREEC